MIFEDERLSAEHLEKLVRQYDYSIEILDVIESVQTGIEWFAKSGQLPDLILMDIQLSDGSCFELFRKINIDTPVIFTTAFNEYALQAFKVNSVDYLLKPIVYAELEAAIDKYKKNNHRAIPDSVQYYEQLYQHIHANSRYKKRLLIKIGDQLKHIGIEDIAYFIFQEGLSYAVSFSNHFYPLDYSLDELERIVDPSVFFRVNRQCIVRPEAIEKIHSYFNNRLKLNLRPAYQDAVIVSRERVADFKIWLDS